MLIKKCILSASIILALTISSQALLTSPPQIPMQGQVTQVIRKNDNTPFVFSLGNDNQVYFSYCKTNAVSFRPIWYKISGSYSISGNLVAISKTNGEMWVFARSSTYVVYSKYTVGNGFSAWAYLGTSPISTLGSSEIAAGLNTDGTIELFAIKFDRTLFRIKQNSDGSWPSWPSTPMSYVTVNNNLAVGTSNASPAGRLQVFAKLYNPGYSNDCQLITFYQQTQGGNWTSSYSYVGGCVSQNIEVVSNHQGNLEVYGCSNSRIYRTVQSGISSWTSWELLPTPPSLNTLCIVKNPDGRLEAFHVNSDYSCVHTWQMTPGTWANCQSASFAMYLQGVGISKPISVIMHPVKQRLMAFVYAKRNTTQTDPQLYSIFQDYLMPGAWSPALSALNAYDLDGNEYSAVQIGSQIWIAQNLYTTKYSDGSVIPLAPSDWGTITYGAYRPIAGMTGNVQGHLYNWYVACQCNSKFLIDGWTLPTQPDITDLQNALGGAAYAGRKLKSTDPQHWLDARYGDNSTGFSAVGAGYCDLKAYNYNYRQTGVFWTTTAGGNGASAFYCTYDGYALSQFTQNVNYGLSVRLMWK